jgi:L-ribulose-5-phosphate 3-epimerase
MRYLPKASREMENAGEENFMDRREFMAAASAAVLAQGLARAHGEMAAKSLAPMALGLIISPFGAPEEHLKRVHDL